MDIAGLGSAIVEQLIAAGLVASPADLYTLDWEKVEALDRMGPQSTRNLRAAIEASKENDLSRLVFALGIRQVGAKAAKVLAMEFGTLDRLMEATEEELTAVRDIGAVTAASIRLWFSEAQSQHLIRRLREVGVNFTCHLQVADKRFEGKTFVLTGTLEHFSRDEAAAEIERFGGKAHPVGLQEDELCRGGGERRVQAAQGPGPGRPGAHRGRVSGHAGMMAAFSRISMEKNREALALWGANLL